MAHTYFLENVEPFCTLPAEDAERILESGRIAVFQPGQQIIKKGAPGESMFLVVGGGVEIPIFRDDGQLRFVNYLGEGELFGEVALLTGEPRTADVYAANQGLCTCLVIERAVVEEIFQRHPPVARFLSELLGKRLLASGDIRRVGKYKLGPQIGEGGMTKVYEGYHSGLGRPVAIKMLSHRLVYTRDFSARFRREGMTIARLRHPNIVDVYDLEWAYGTWFIIMEMLHGTSAENKVLSEGPMEFGEIRRVLWDVLCALEHAHKQGIVHRDIKPDNIVLEEDGAAKLVDFGIALSGTRQDEVARAGLYYMGTPQYSPPEYLAEGEIDGRADLYSLGLTAYTMVTGKRPFPGQTSEEILEHQLATPTPDCCDHRDDVPADIERFIAGCTAKDPADRFASATAVMREFAAWGRPSGFGTGLVLAVFHGPEHTEDVRRILDETERKLNALEGVRAGRTPVLER